MRKADVKIKENELFINSTQLFSAVHKRARRDEISYNLFIKLIRCFLDIIIERFLDNKPIIIDNFGTLSRKRGKKRLFNVGTREFMETHTDTAVLIPNSAFVEYLHDPENKKILWRIIKERSKRAPTNTGKVKHI